MMKYILPLLLVLAFALPAEARMWKPLRYLALPVVVPYVVGAQAYNCVHDRIAERKNKEKLKWNYFREGLIYIDLWLNYEPAYMETD